jgi:hypothetical protein
MTSFKKPLFAIASAVALVSTMIIASPANAATVTLSGGDYNSSSMPGTISAKAVTIPVPADNKVDAADVLTIAITSAPANSNVVFSATNARIVTELHATDKPVTSFSGSSSVTVSTGAGTTATVYVFTTTTKTGSVSVSIGGNVNTYYVKGSAGPAYTLSLVAPTFAGLGSDASITAVAKDVFGNSAEDAIITTTVLRGSVKTELTWNSSDSLYKGVLSLPATSGFEFGVANILATDVPGLPKAVTEVSFKIEVLDLNEAVTKANAKIAKLEKKIEKLKKKNKKLKNKISK